MDSIDVTQRIETFGGLIEEVRLNMVIVVRNLALLAMVKKMCEAEMSASIVRVTAIDQRIVTKVIDMIATTMVTVNDPWIGRIVKTGIEVMIDTSADIGTIATIRMVPGRHHMTGIAPAVHHTTEIAIISVPGIAMTTTLRTDTVGMGRGVASGIEMSGATEGRDSGPGGIDTHAKSH